MIFADKRMELGNHLRKMPMGYFTSGNIGKISSILSTDMVFIEEVSMSTIGNMMSYMLSTLVLAVFMFVLDWRLGLIQCQLLLCHFHRFSDSLYMLPQSDCIRIRHHHHLNSIVSFLRKERYNIIVPAILSYCADFAFPGRVIKKR